MKAILLLAVGAGAGAAVVGLGGAGPWRASRHDVVVETKEVLRVRADYDGLVAELRARIAELEAQLAGREKPPEPDPYANDTPEDLERMVQEAFADNNVDWLLEAIARLLRMGKEGYPILRKMLEDIIFRAKFLPAESDFRIDQLYKLGRIFANNEKEFIGFLDYLLTDPNTNPWFKQGAMMGAAFYVGSKAPGSEALQATLMQMFLTQAGGGAGAAAMMPLPGNLGKKMQVFAMAMSGDPKMVAPLHDELRRTKDKNLQGDIIGALAYLGDPKALPLIQERLDPSQGDFRAEIRALGRLDTPESHQTADQFLRSIRDSKSFYRHTGTYLRSGGGAPAVMLMKERIESNPADPEIGTAVGTLRRFPTKESLETLVMIRDTVPDAELQKRAGEAAEEVGARLRGEIPPVPPAGRSDE
jgi:hypothetical protein